MQIHVRFVSSHRITARSHATHTLPGGRQEVRVPGNSLNFHRHCRRHFTVPIPPQHRQRPKTRYVIPFYLEGHGLSINAKFPAAARTVPGRRGKPRLNVSRSCRGNLGRREHAATPFPSLPLASGSRPRRKEEHAETLGLLCDGP